MKKVLLLLLIMLPWLTNAQTTSELDSMLTNIIKTIPKQNRERLDYIRTHFFDTLSLSETDSIGQKNLYARFYFSFADSSYDFSELYYRTQDSKPYITYQQKGNMSKRLVYIYHHSEMTQEKLISDHKHSKPVTYIPYRKEQTVGTGCFCYTGMKLVRLKKQTKRHRARQLENHYAISIYRVDSVTKITVEVPPKNPDFHIEVLCGKW